MNQVDSRAAEGRANKMRQGNIEAEAEADEARTDTGSGCD